MATLNSLTVLDPDARVLTTGDLRAVFLPGRGMLGASLEHRGEELLGRVDDLEAFARAGRTCGIPLLHPWANRLGGTRYHAGGRDVSLDSVSALIGHDDKGLPMHGVPWSRLIWQVTDQASDSLNAQLEWNTEELLAVFPFPHRLELKALLNESALMIETTLIAGASSPVPVSFGFHPYFRIPGLARADWHVTLPAMSHLQLDERNIPTGQETPFASFDEMLGERALDDGFVLLDEPVAFALEGNGRKITIEFLEGYPYAQVFAPPDKELIAIEPMTAPANALISGRGLRLVAPGGRFRATFRIRIQVLL